MKRGRVSLPRALWRRARKGATALFSSCFPGRWKKMSELAYWRSRKKLEGELTGDHYKFFFTDHFGLSDEFYDGKVILDIGCGPRGSLEWATMAARRIGLDPLAKEYLWLGAGRHRMEYVSGHAERIPLADGSCDAVFSFNSLDHVDDVRGAMSEIKRVTRPGGCFLLLVEVNHAPTATEPHRLEPASLIQLLETEFRCIQARLYRPTGEGMYDAVREGHEIDAGEWNSAPGYLSAKFIRDPG